MARKKSGSAWWGAMLVIIVASFALGCDKPGEGNHKAEVHEDAPPHAAARGRREAEPGTVKPAALKPPAVKPDVEPSPTLEKQLMKQQEKAALRSRDGWKEFDALCLSAEKLEERALHTKKSDGLDEALHLRQGALRKLEELRNLEEECYHRANKLHELRVYEDALMNLGRDPQVYLDGLKEIREVQAMVRERMKKVDHIMGEAELAGTLARKGAGLKPPDSFFSDVAKCHQFLDELAELAEDVRQKQARLKARVRKNKSLIQESAKVLARGYVLQEKVVARTERCPRCEGSGRVFRYHVGRGKTREYPASRTQGPPTTNTARCSKCGGKGFLRAGTRKVKVRKRLDGITIGRIRKRLSILKRTVAQEEAELKVLEDAANIVQEGTLKISVALAEGNQVPLQLCESVLSQTKEKLGGNDDREPPSGGLGLGISYEQVMADLSPVFPMKQQSPIKGEDNYVGIAPTGVLQVIGKKANVSEEEFLFLVDRIQLRRSNKKKEDKK